MAWIFLGIIAGTIGFLAMVIIDFIKHYREKRDKIEQTQIYIKRREIQFAESEKTRIEAEDRTTILEIEGQEYEHKISELHHKINSVEPSDTQPENSA